MNSNSGEPGRGKHGATSCSRPGRGQPPTVVGDDPDPKLREIAARYMASASYHRMATFASDFSYVRSRLFNFGSIHRKDLFFNVSAA
jgi:hypothetical protein